MPELERIADQYGRTIVSPDPIAHAKRLIALLPFGMNWPKTRIVGAGVNSEVNSEGFRLYSSTISTSSKDLRKTFTAKSNGQNR